MTVWNMASEWQVSGWLGDNAPVSLSSLRGRVVVAEVFQMLCPGCVSRGLPQAEKIAAIFPRSEVVVLGLHSVFEHHEAQGSSAALKAFMHEYRITFPVAMDAPSFTEDTPATMSAYQMRGTPTQLLIDREGRLRRQSFGIVDDMRVGAEIASLLGESVSALNRGESKPSGAGCSDDVCERPS